ncbi:MAG: hypothetical protein QXF52_10230 [Thermoproteota archaeon]
MKHRDSLEAVNLRGKKGSQSHIKKPVDILRFNVVKIIMERV